MLRRLSRSLTWLALLPALSHAAPFIYRPVLNIQTGRPDLVTPLSTSTVKAGSNITVSTNSDGSITIGSTGGGSGSFSGINASGQPLLTSSATLLAGTGISLSQSGSTITVTASGGAASSLAISFNGVLVSSPTGGIDVKSPLVVTLVGSTPTISVSLSTTAPSSGSTNYVQITNSLQANSTFYVSSGTVNTLYAGSVTARNIPNGYAAYSANGLISGDSGYQWDSSAKTLSVTSTAGQRPIVTVSPNSGGFAVGSFFTSNDDTELWTQFNNGVGSLSIYNVGSGGDVLSGTSAGTGDTVFYSGLNTLWFNQALKIGGFPGGHINFNSYVSSITVANQSKSDRYVATFSTDPSTSYFVTIATVGAVTINSSTTFNGTLNVSSGFLASGAAGSSGQVLQSNGIGTTPSWVTSSGSGGSTNGTILSSTPTTLGVYSATTSISGLAAGTTNYGLLSGGNGINPYWAPVIISTEILQQGTSFYVSSATIGNGGAVTPLTVKGNKVLFENNNNPFLNRFDLTFSQTISNSSQTIRARGAGSISNSIQPSGIDFITAAGVTKAYINFENSYDNPAMVIPSTAALAWGDGTSGHKTVGFRQPASVAADTIWSLPSSDTAGFWKSDGSKNLSIATLSAADLSAILSSTNVWTAGQTYISSVTFSSTTLVNSPSGLSATYGISAASMIIGSPTAANETGVLSRYRFNMQGVAHTESSNSDANSSAGFEGVAISSSGNAFLILSRSSGTVGSPLATQSAMTMARIGSGGYGATGWIPSTTGRMDFIADGNFTDASAPTRIDFFTTPSGSITTAMRMRIGSNGAVTFVSGSSVTVQDPSGLGVTYNVTAGSMTGAGLSNCGSTSQAVSWASGTSLFGCTTITAAGIGALTGNQTITISGDSSGSGTTSITNTNAALQGNITTFSASSITINGNLVVAGSETVKGANGMGVTYNLNVGSMTGAGLTTCGDSTHALAYTATTGLYSCQSITGTGGGSGGYAVEPATVAFLLNQGMRASTGTFTSSVTVSGALGMGVTYGVTAGSMTIQPLTDGTSIFWIKNAAGQTVGRIDTSTSNVNDSATQIVASTSGTFGLAVSTFAAGPYFLLISTDGHIHNEGPAPTLSSCGTSPTTGTNCSDHSCQITPGATAGGCTVTFAKPYKNNPVCTVTEETFSLTNALTYTISTTALTMTETALTSKLDYICDGKD